MSPSDSLDLELEEMVDRRDRIAGWGIPCAWDDRQREKLAWELEALDRHIARYQQQDAEKVAS